MYTSLSTLIQVSSPNTPRKWSRKTPKHHGFVFFCWAVLGWLLLLFKLLLQVTSLWNSANRIPAACVIYPEVTGVIWESPTPRCSRGLAVVSLFWDWKGFRNRSGASGIVSITHVPHFLVSASPLLADLVGFWHAFFFLFPPCIVRPDLLYECAALIDT